MARYAGYSRKHRKARRRARTTKRFGSASEVHSERGSSASGMASAAAVDAANEARDGDCKNAVKSLSSAYGWFGHAVAHSQAGGRGITLGPTSSTLLRAREEVITHCVRKGR